MAVLPVQRITVSEFKRSIRKTADRVNTEAERFVLTSHRNKEVAVLISIKDLALLTLIEDHIHREQGSEALKEAYKEFQEQLSAAGCGHPK